MESLVAFVRLSFWAAQGRYDIDVRPRELPETIREFESALAVLKGLQAGMETLASEES